MRLRTRQQAGRRSPLCHTTLLRQMALLLAVGAGLSGMRLAADTAGQPPAAALAAATGIEARAGPVPDVRLPDSAPAALLLAATPAFTSAPVTLAMVSASAPALPTTGAAAPAPVVAEAVVAASAAAVAAPVEPPAAPAAVVPAAAATAEPTPVAPPSTAQAATATAPRFATAADVAATLARSPWPQETWARVIAIAFCETGVDSDRDGQYDMVDTRAQGAGGLYIGALQISREHHFRVPYDLYALTDNLTAGYELWLGAGRSFAPWGC